MARLMAFLLRFDAITNDAGEISRLAGATM